MHKIMKDFLIPGIVSLVLGLLMTMFHRAIGVWFCQSGKAIWDKAKDSPNALVRSMAKDAPQMYDEKKATGIMRLLGIVFVIQGVFLVVVGMIR